ncbi:prolyl-tRNA synthetase associated domain-containing protein [Limosilactobacillus sp. Sa3CUN2]|uniref:Prolyl-tRNA synthetase associated domain-containing protein n=1 Tax=Limosilactobacillus avistercoris TaxID=2762243 RepID=A0ABR8PD73_9LACO|nr:prolyl-tRNA synthetase associated domain-containing protein [Limosilactobacillus avistercoris]MBD7895241.1 prolyl-tRNA synthetase associated domain-containing protein [Limosilactobacillus avistercoris]
MNPQQIYQLLDKAKINYEVIHHPVVFTSAEADRYVEKYSFARTKNLFLRTHNRKSYFLYVLLENNQFVEKTFRQAVGTSRLSFVSLIELKQILGIEPGSVSPFNLLNDQDKQVKLIVSRQVLVDNDLIGVHPNDNTQTIILRTTDLLKFLECNKINTRIIND